MKLAAIYNIWDAEEHLLPSIRLIAPHVDLIIIVWQGVSNYGEIHSPWPAIREAIDMNEPGKIIEQKYRVEAPLAGAQHSYAEISGHEIAKRNLGLDIARQYHCTHFLHLDADEYWPQFEEAKESFIQSDMDASISAMYTYFKQPNWRLQRCDNYFVPFIHKLQTNTAAGAKKYPYYVDPTRRITGFETSGNVAMLSIRMHHLSWVRNNIERKINNSTARANIQKSQLLSDYNNPAIGPGYYLKDYDQTLVEVEPPFPFVIQNEGSAK